MNKDPLCIPIARGGEQIFASIIRNSSGMDAGCIDYGCRTYELERLCDGEKQDIADTAYALYQSICRAADKKAKNDR